MSMYNMMFGENGMADAILAVLGLTREACGRFRDCGVSNGEVYIYTRNGGGNRGHCWHDGSDAEYGSPLCKNHSIEKEEDEYIVENQHYKKTGRRVMGTYYVCEEPDSESCACPACVMNYRLPKHPNYLRDEDDDFDSTYSTIYFSFPEEFAEDLKKLDSGETFDPDKKWLDAIEKLKTGV